MWDTSIIKMVPREGLRGRHSLTGSCHLLSHTHHPWGMRRALWAQTKGQLLHPEVPGSIPLPNCPQGAVLGAKWTSPHWCLDPLYKHKLFHSIFSDPAKDRILLWLQHRHTVCRWLITFPETRLQLREHRGIQGQAATGGARLKDGKMERPADWLLHKWVHTKLLHASTRLSKKKGGGGLRNLEITYNFSPNIFYTVLNRSQLHSKNPQVTFIVEQDRE